MDKSRIDIHKDDDIVEATAPPPIQNPEEHHKARHIRSEDRLEVPAQQGTRPPMEPPSPRSRAPHESENYDNLDELEAPPPVQNPEESHWHLHRDLEENRLEDEEAASTNSRSSTQTPYENEHSHRSKLSDSNLQHQDLHRHENLEENTSLEQKTKPQPQNKAQPFTHLYTTSYLIFFSILGTLSRLGVQALTTYPGAPITIPELWANVGGCFIMGYLNEAIKSNKSKNHKKMPIYIGLGVGFCGSFTSFSSFMRDLFFALADNIDICAFANDVSCVEGGRSRGDSVMAVLAVVFVEVCLCISALLFGAHVAIGLDSVVSRIPVSKVARVLDRVVVVLGLGLWIGAIVMAIWPPDRPSGSVAGEGTLWAQETWRGKCLFAVVFAPVGCLTRFHASLRLNGLLVKFPVGTFVVNIAGTMVLGMCWDLQRAPLGDGIPGGGLVGCQVLQGVQDGFCGCLTTVSTWVVELQGLRRKHAYFYGFMSVGIGLSSLVVIMGPLLWKTGISEPLCGMS